MITTGFETRVKVQQIIENQLPEFILSESPKAVDFLKQYYISQEYQSGPVDISENLDQYLKLDNLTPDVIVGFTELQSQITETDDVISVNSTKGFPTQYGLLKIDNEIITYTGITPNSFTGCVRGFSGITSYRSDSNQNELQFSSTSSASHESNSRVENLSSLFLKEFYKKLKYSLTPGLEDVDFVSNLNVGNFIKESRSFYESKGTEESFRILFNVLYGVTPKIVDLEGFLLKPSSANFLRREVIIIEPISGDPNKLVGQTIVKSKDLNTNGSVSEVEIFTRNRQVGYAQTYYKVGLFVGFSDDDLINGTFKITPNTKNLTTVSAGSSIITVDSTIGFAQTGTLLANNNVITYSSKNINQFFGCLGIENEITVASDIFSDDIYFGYENGDTSKKVEFKITGSLSSFETKSDISSAIEGEEIFVRNVGEKIFNGDGIKEKFFNSWIYNTSSRFAIDSAQTASTYTLKGNPNKTSLKVGDTVEIVGSKTQTPIFSGAIVSNINYTKREVTLDNLSGFDLSTLSGYYDLRRVVKTASSSNQNIKFGNNLVLSDIQNTYNDGNEFYYVASNSLPSYQINEKLISEQIDTAEANITLQGYNSNTSKYSIISFNSNVNLLTGDEVYYQPELAPLFGIEEGIYYVRVVGGGNQIRLYSSRSFIDIDDYLEFGVPTSNSGYHRFTLSSDRNLSIEPQSIFRKFPSEKNLLDSGIDETEVGPIGMMVNGVEIFNYKSDNKIYYGPLNEVTVFNSGSNYDVINPPTIEVSTPSAGTTAYIQPVVSGSVKSVVVDPSDFDISNVISISITGGNGNGAVLEPVLRKRYREVSFSGNDISSSGGGIDSTNETITFLSNHNFKNGEKIVYNKNGNSEIGIGTFGASNTDQGRTLINGSAYFAEIVNSSTIKLYQSETDYYSGINTVGFTTIANSGVHKFRVFNGKNNISQIKVLNSGSGYTNRKLNVNSSGISTSENLVTFKNHNFKSGELVNYSSDGTVITGLSTSNQYYILKENNDSFRLANAGVGGTISSNYISKNYVKFESPGTGYHTFSYPDITLNINVSYGSSIVGVITATPVIRGEIVDAYLYDSGTGYGSTVLNLHKRPAITIKNGKSAELRPLITAGSIERVSILARGTEYNAAPDLIVRGDGTGAVLRAVVSNGSITDVVVINSGSGYTDNTYISVVPPGSGAVLDVNVRSLTVNNHSRFGDEILHPSGSGLQYGLVGYSTQIGNSILIDDGSKHSPIVGWAYDGNPIYGPYGYSDPENINSDPVLIRTGYELLPSRVINRPPSFNSGFFVEDYSYTSTGNLDDHNGRYCKTPEFPNGVYAYFCGITTNLLTNSLVPSFPYFVGNTFKSKYIAENKKLNQAFDFESSNLMRNTYPYSVSEQDINNDFIPESYEIVSQRTRIDSVTQGSVDSLSIISSGEDYKIGDIANFNDDGTGGGGLTASVSSLEGKNIINLVTETETYEDVVVVWKNKNQLEIKTTSNHTLVDGENITISGLSTFVPGLSKTHKIGVTTDTTYLIKEVSSNAISGVVTDIYVSRNLNNISVGSTIGIGTEVLSVLNIFDQEKVLRVKRGVTGAAHTISTAVLSKPSEFTINLPSNYFDSKVNDRIYFNPVNSVGIGSTTGAGSQINYFIGDVAKVVSVPTQSIYIPNHPFKTNQQVTFYTNGASTISVGATSLATPFALPVSGTSQTLYVINKSKDYIGLTTLVGLTTNTDGLFFFSNGSNSYEYYLETNYNQLTAKVEKINTTVSLSTDHQLKRNDKIRFNITPSETVGIGTSTHVRVKYNSSIERVLVDTVGFGSESINVDSNKINITNHGYLTGDILFYDSSDLISSGLNTGRYYVYRVDENNIQLVTTEYNLKLDPPSVVSIASTGGSGQELSYISPRIECVKGNSLKFDLSDSSLNGFEFKIYTNNTFSSEFVSIGETSNFTISGVGTVGVSSEAHLTLNYSSSIPSPLFYNVEKSGYISTSDKTVKNDSSIHFVDSKYGGIDYPITSVGSTTFTVSLSRNPEKRNYDQTNCSNLKYTTTSLNEKGGVHKLSILSGGVNYKKTPSFVDITSVDGKNASITPNSNTIGRIKNTTILDQGFSYSSDLTLRPEAYISPQIKLKNSSEISSVFVRDGGKNLTAAPQIVIVNSETRKIIDEGLLQPVLATGSITQVDIVRTPKGLPFGNTELFAVDNTNGIGINTIASSSSGLVTCYISTPVFGYTNPPFAEGDRIYVEGIENIPSTGNGLNSSDNGFNFFTVTKYQNTNPATVEFNVSGFTTNPGLAKTNQGLYASIINYANYPKFEVTNKYSSFSEGEKLLTFNGFNFELRDLIVTEYGDDYLKVYGSYSLQKDEIVKGQYSGTLATISSIKENKGTFKIDYSLRKDYDWSNNIGKLNVDYQVLPDNDYYQNLSYSVKSPVSYEDLSNPVNRLLHTSGLKNFADTEIQNSVNVGTSRTATSNSVIVRDILEEKRVDTINFYDNVLDIDVSTDGKKSKYLKLENKVLADYIRCDTNRVVRIDDFSPQFRNQSNITEDYVDVVSYDNTYSEFLIQLVDPNGNDRQLTELVVLNSSSDSITLEKTSLHSTEQEVANIESYLDVFGNLSIRVTPEDKFDTDYDIKVLSSSFNSILGGIGTQSVGFVNLTGANALVGSGITETLVGFATDTINSVLAKFQAYNQLTGDMDYAEFEITHDGENSYVSEVYSNNKVGPISGFIGTFGINVDSGLLSIKYTNNSTTDTLVRGKIVGFGTTSVGTGTYRFKTSSQPDGSERSVRFESNNSIASSSSTILSLDKTIVSSVKSLVRVSYGETTSIHQVMLVHDNIDVYTTQYPFLSIGSTCGMGTFSGNYSGSNVNLVFHPDSEISGSYEIQSLDKIFYSETDTVNVPPDLNYGPVTEEVELAFYNSRNGDRSNKLDFELNYEGTPIFAKRFNPSDSNVLNLATGTFTIKDHFFSTGERLNYRPDSSIIGVGFTSVGIGSTATEISGGVGIGTTDVLPSSVYAIKVTNDEFRLATTPQYAAAGIGVTFTSVGTGNYHQLEMHKRIEKVVLSVDGVIQYPIAFNPLGYSLVDNGGQVSSGSTYISVSGIASIRPADILKIDDEYVKVIAVGFGTTSTGPIDNVGVTTLVNISRGFVGSSATSHLDSTSFQIYRGSYNIAGSKLFFTEPPKGGADNGINLSNLREAFSSFNGRVFLKKDYSSNVIYDDISDQFTGIGRTFTLTSSGLNTTGISTGSGILLINDVFQTPTTDNNAGNDYELNDEVGITSVTFAGITSSNGQVVIDPVYIEQNQLPRGGYIISLGSTNGLGYAPLVGASVTAFIDGSGSITAVGIGSTDINGSGYAGPVSVAVTSPTGYGADISAIVGAGGSLSFTVDNPGTGYAESNTFVSVSAPSYENMPVTGVSRLGIGTTSETGTGLLLSLEVGASSTTGIGSTLFEVKSFNITRPGYGFRNGDVFKPIGLVTDRNLSEPISGFELTVIETFTDSFSAWQFGELDYIDSIANLQDGKRTRFPLYYNSQLISFQKDSENVDSADIDLNALLIIFVNGVIQDPGVNYNFDGGTSFSFSQAPEETDNVSIFFYRGTRGVDSDIIDVNETIKIGDVVQVLKNANADTVTQNPRTVVGITSSDVMETNLYNGPGIDENQYKPLSWSKQKADKIIGNEFVSKSRDSIETQVYPTAKIIKNVSDSSNEIFVDDAYFFNYEENESAIVIDSFNLLMVDSVDPVSAAVTAVISTGGTVQSIDIINAGSGYTGSSVDIKISSPPHIKVGVGTTATATISIVNGSLSGTANITNPGLGYTIPPKAIVEFPAPNYENIGNVSTVEGFSGIITGIGTTVGTGGHGLGLKLFLNASFFTGLSVNYPICVVDTKVGHGVTSVDSGDASIVSIGTTFLDNIYYIHDISVSGGNAEILTNIRTDTSTVGIAITGSSTEPLGRFSWGRLSGMERSTSPISIGVTGLTFNSGLTTFPTIQRRGFGLRNTGSLRKDL